MEQVIEMLVRTAEPILYALGVIIAGYVAAYVKLKTGVEKQRALKEIAQDTVIEVEELARTRKKSGNGEMISSVKQDFGEDLLLEKAKNVGIRIPGGKRAAFGLVKWAVGKIR